MIDYYIKDDKNPYVTVRTTDRHGKDVEIDYHSYLFGLMGAIKKKKDINRHALILVVAPPGDGKSTFVEGMAGLDNLFMGNRLEIDDIAWSMDKFISKMDSKDNIGRSIWGDEFIQAGGNRAMAISNIGNRLKIGFVTKRLKKNTYFLVLDNPKEFAEKVVEMADALIVIKSFGFLRGYFDCYTEKTNIMFIYKAFKEFNKTWKSKEVRRIKPDSKGKFADWNGIFIDPVEFDKRKMDETSQEVQNSKSKLNWDIRKTKAYVLWSQGVKYKEIYSKLNIPTSTLNMWVPEFKKVQATELIDSS